MVPGFIVSDKMTMIFSARGLSCVLLQSVSAVYNTCPSYSVPVSLVPYIVSCLVYIYCPHTESVYFLKVLNVLCVHSNTKFNLNFQDLREIILHLPCALGKTKVVEYCFNDQLYRDPVFELIFWIVRIVIEFNISI